MRIGNGYDVHRLVENRPLIIGGVTIDWHLGLEGHSDADVLLHAVCDACIGAAGQGDIGRHFPPSDEQYRGADSRTLVRRVRQMLTDENWEVVNLDCIIVAQQPRLTPHFPQMKENIARDLEIDGSRVNVKATTTDGLGFCGREQGIAAYTVVLLERPGHIDKLSGAG